MRPPEEIKREMVQEWLCQANEDFGLVEHLVSQNARYLRAVAFHAQQAAEKYLKAFLVHCQCEFPKTHDIDEILDLVATVDKPLAESLREATDLSPYAVDTRYPGDFPDVSEDDAKRGLSLARAVRDKILSVLSTEKDEAPRRDKVV